MQMNKAEIFFINLLHLHTKFALKLDNNKVIKFLDLTVIAILQ